jgi:hypothetical protein
MAREYIARFDPKDPSRVEPVAPWVDYQPEP